MGHQHSNEFKDRFVYEARLIKVIDGDTVAVNVDLGFNIFYKIHLRLEGFNTDKAAKKVLERLLYMNRDGDIRGKTLFIETEKGWSNSDNSWSYLTTIWLPTEHLHANALNAYTEMFNHKEWLNVNEYMRDYNKKNSERV